MSTASPVDFAKFERLRELAAERRKRGIPPTESDRKWFERERRQRTRAPRLYRIRPSVVDDHPAFAAFPIPPNGYLTIIVRDTLLTAVVAIASEQFGAWIDSDEYASMRLSALSAEIKADARE